MCATMAAGAKAPLSSGSWAELRNELRVLRETDERASEYAATAAKKVLSRSTMIGDEKWAIYEQAAMAHLDNGNLGEAQKYCALIQAQFPDSPRYARVAGMLLEARGEVKKAIQMYTDALKSHPTNACLLKRRIAAFRGTGNVVMAQNLLKQYLELYAVDKEAWLEMADICLSQNDLEEAVFCYEELVLGNPNNHLYHARLAEVAYTSGGFENLVTARKHFSAALKILPTNLRALLGLQRTCRTLVKHSECTSETEDKTKQLLAMATERIARVAATHSLLTVVS